MCANTSKISKILWVGPQLASILAQSHLKSEASAQVGQDGSILEAIFFFIISFQWVWFV